MRRVGAALGAVILTVVVLLALRPGAESSTSTAAPSATIPRPTTLQTSATPTALGPTSTISMGSATSTLTLETTTSGVAASPSSTSGHAVSTSTSLPPTTTSSSVDDFQASISRVDGDDLHESWRSGCPVGPGDLRAVTVSHWGYDGKVRTGTLIVAAAVAEDMVAIMSSLHADRFPIERMVPVDVFDADDDLSMAANNTSAFNCRAVTGGSSWSEHSYGTAVDVNPLVNPYVRGDTVLPPEGFRYADRSLDAPGMIHAGDEVVDAFTERGWIWGGTWSSPKDYQHFSTSGR